MLSRVYSFGFKVQGKGFFVVLGVLAGGGYRVGLALLNERVLGSIQYPKP